MTHKRDGEGFLRNGGKTPNNRDLNGFPRPDSIIARADVLRAMTEFNGGLKNLVNDAAFQSFVDAGLDHAKSLPDGSQGLILWQDDENGRDKAQNPYRSILVPLLNKVMSKLHTSSSGQKKDYENEVEKAVDDWCGTLYGVRFYQDKGGKKELRITRIGAIERGLKSLLKT